MPDESTLKNHVDGLEKEVRVLKAQLAATKRLLCDLAVASLGDSPETATFLERLERYTLEYLS